MLTSRIIPCLDVRGNLVVKGIKFAGLREVGNPAELALAYENQGADEIVVLDVAATNQNRDSQIETVKEVRQVLSIPLTVGGGIRGLDDVERLTNAGADRVSVNTAAVKRPEFVNEIATRFGCQCTVVAIDARRNENRWEVVTHAGQNLTGLDAIEWARIVEDKGAGEILLTSFDRDGTRSGYDCELLTAISENLSIPVIASGGADNSTHLREGFDAGAAAVLLASILHDGVVTVGQLKRELTEMGINIRP